jgi:hypothetical protein
MDGQRLHGFHPVSLHRNIKQNDLPAANQNRTIRNWNSTTKRRPRS